MPDATLQQLERRLHAVMRERAGVLIAEQGLVLPSLTAPVPLRRSPAWFPIPGMYGGFRYWVEGRGAMRRLIAESWSRTDDGSGQRHEITIDGVRLIAQGFV